MLKDLARSLKHVAAHTGGVDRAQAHFEDAKRAEARGDLLGATNALRLAVAISPERMDVQEAYARVSHALLTKNADQYEADAKSAEEGSSWQEAALAWSKVCEGRPDDFNAHIRAAENAIRGGLPLSDAKRFAQRAVDLDENSALALRVLGEVFVSAGMKVNARKSLEAAAKLDPKDEAIKNLLKKLK